MTHHLLLRFMNLQKTCYTSFIIFLNMISDVPIAHK